jgi:hypothetical protein
VAAPVATSRLLPAAPPIVNINITKFQPISSPYVPALNQLWQDALVNVDYRRELIIPHPNQGLMRGYPVLDPKILFNSSRITIYILSWLMLRKAWNDRTTHRTDVDITLPSPQEWKDYLFEKVAVRLGIPTMTAVGRPHIPHPGPSSGGGRGSSSNSRRRGASLTSRGRAAPRNQGARSDSHTSSSSFPSSASESRPDKRRKETDVFAMDLSTITGPEDLFWNKVVVVKAAELPKGNIVLSTEIIQEVVWDLYENNFRLELLALDQCIHSGGDRSRFGAAQREGLVRACFPGYAFIQTDLPIRHEGMGAARWTARSDFVEAFRVILASWPGPEAKRLQATSVYGFSSPMYKECSEASVTAVEQIAYPFYCNMFFRYFGRAPSVPHQLPRRAC